MSGHSHWSKIRWQKGLADAKRGKAFSKMSREITIAAKEGGGDIGFNSKLRMAVERARSSNMPADNIDKAIKKGTGELEGGILESVILEAYGPGGIAIIIEGITDNKNRTLGEIKQLLSQNNGKLIGEGGVRWLFERKEKDGRLEWIPQYEIELSEKNRESCQKLFDALDENDAVQEIYSNIKSLQSRDED